MLAAGQVVNFGLFLLISITASMCFILGSGSAQDPVFKLMEHAFTKPDIKIHVWDQYCNGHHLDSNNNAGSSVGPCEQFGAEAQAAFDDQRQRGSTCMGCPSFPNRVTATSIFGNCSTALEHGGNNAGRIGSLCRQCTSQCRAWATADIKWALVSDYSPLLQTYAHTLTPLYARRCPQQPQCTCLHCSSSSLL